MAKPLMADSPDQVMLLAAHVRDGASSSPGQTGRGGNIAMPPERIEQFDDDIAARVLGAALAQGDRPPPELQAWLEKIRRFAEINRADLWSVSVRRFQDPAGAGGALRRMLVVLAAVSACRSDLLLFNACAAVRDGIGSRCGTSAEIKFADDILDKPGALVARRQNGGAR